ncbi:MAG TPA: DUF3267 domain-containing protein [Bacteroidales bacterium]|nr:DUF3267 domain-containing protein [Bacteroidales bacterium]
MPFSVEDLDDPKNFRVFLTVPYKNLAEFVFEYLKKKSTLTILFWSVCLVFLCLTLSIRIRIAHYFPYSHILYHSVLGMIILPLLIIPIHELLHVIPYYFSGARNIRIGMDLKQYLFYVTAHRYVASPVQFRIVAVTPFIIISAVLIFLIFLLPGLWKWSLSVFLFAHATMCAGDFALLNLYFLNKDKKLYTWDDADKKEAYFYEKI